MNLLQRAKEAWYQPETKRWKAGKKYLQVSTDEVYGALGAEGYFMETTPINPHSPYSASKASADHFVQAFHDTYGMPVNITRCSNNYGPYQFPEKLIPLMINNVKHHKQLPVYGDGMQVRDWLYVEDHCKAIDMVAEGGRSGEVYNVGGHNERPNIFIVKTIIEQLHERLQDEGISEALIRHVEDRLGHEAGRCDPLRGVDGGGSGGGPRKGGEGARDQCGRHAEYCGRLQKARLQDDIHQHGLRI